ncbi:MAG: peptidyl-prolyl cis-trans isomerase [Polymorphobacter sp.]
MNFRQIVREPLLHFLLIGLAFFLLYGVVSPGDSAGRSITVSKGEVADLRRQYAALWGGPPTDQQLAGLIEARVRDEILYREGMAQGLDRDDPVIKRRIRQKVEVMAEEEGAAAAPTDAVLNTYLQSKADKFVKPAVVSFEQVYFNPQGPDTPASVAAARARLNAGAAVAGMGQPTMLPARVTRSDADLVARDFGADFAAAVVKLPVGQWSGPVGSGVGVHLVRLTELLPPTLPPPADIRAEVIREWENDRRVAASEASYKRARANYDVVIEGKP